MDQTLKPACDDASAGRLENRNPIGQTGAKIDLGASTSPVSNLTAQAGFELGIPTAHLTSRQLQFLLRVTPAALQSEHEYGIPASITIAQAILESATAAGWGTSRLFVEANNPFGIKYCHFGAGDLPGCPTNLPAQAGGRRAQAESELRTGEILQRPPLPAQAGGTPKAAALPCRQAGPRPALPAGSPQPPEDYGHFDAATWEIENGQRKEILAQFQRFPNLAEAFRAHALLLARTPRYAPAMAVVAQGSLSSPAVLTGRAEAAGPESGSCATAAGAPPAWQVFAERLGPRASANDSEHCGYSTNPSYSATLIKLIEEYRLHDPRAQEWYATGKDPGPA